MATAKIKLNTYIIIPKEKHKKNTSDNYKIFDDLETESGEKADFKKLFIRFIQLFDNKFLTMKGKEQAMRVNNPNAISFGSESRIIRGFFEAGRSGTLSTVYDVDGEERIVLNPKDVNSIKYGFLLHLPKDKAVGILIVQGTSSESAGELFKTLLQPFLNKQFKNTSFIMRKHTSQEALEKLKKDSEIKSITLTKSRYPAEYINGVTGREIANKSVKVKIIIEGLNTPYSKFANWLEEKTDTNFRDHSKFFSSESLQDFGFDEDYSISVGISDGNNNARAKSHSGFELSSFTYVDEDQVIRNPISGNPTDESIEKILLNHLEEIKKSVYIEGHE